MELRRKAVLFSLIALMMAGLFILLFSTDVRTPRDYRNPLVELKVRSLKFFSESSEDYMRDAAVLSSRRVLEGMADHIATKDMHINSEEELHCFFDQMFRNGTVGMIGGVAPGEPLSAKAGRVSTGPYPYNNWQDPLLAPPPETEVIPGTKIYQRFRPLMDGSIRGVENVWIYTDQVIPDVTMTVQLWNVSCGLPSELLATTQVVFNSVNRATPAADWTAPHNIQFAAPVGLKQTFEYLLVFSADGKIFVGHERLTPDDPSVVLGNIVPNLTYAPLDYSSFNALMGNYSDLAADNLNINSSVTLNDVSIFQVYPWVVQVRVNTTMRSQDNYSTYTKNFTFDVEVPIAGLQDPLFAYWGKYPKMIVPTNITQDADFNVQSFTQFVKDEQYKAAKNISVSYLDRLMDHVVLSDCCGIMSVITPSRIPLIADRDIANYSYIDFFFINDTLFNQSCSELFNITYNDPLWKGTDDPGGKWMNVSKFDWAHLVHFGVANTYWNLTQCPPLP
ncbi:MAG: hypothetical protein ABIH41_04645 [Nanoarchaeota archaeon]